MSRRLVGRVSRMVERRPGRRGFLRSSAMAATAMAVAPVAYAIRPTTAEAAVVLCRGHQCSPGALCCDGWTEFCCKLTGENLCPPGTIVAGWWKADGSGFCDLGGPRPRYYLDCNLTCDDGCRCPRGLCARNCTAARCQCSGGCDTRKSECLTFRYGQCNQNLCVGPIKCRIVTCVPPWRWDPACASSPVLSSPSTRFHDRPCLHDGFTDIPPSAFYAEAVEWMASQDIAVGLTDDLFGPEELVTRGQFALFLWRYEGSPRTKPSGAFNDVNALDHWVPAVEWMAANRITKGRAPGLFHPWSNVNRVQAIVFLHRLAGAPQGSAPIEFTDVDEDAWFRDALAWAIDKGIVWWTDLEVFGAELPASRADVAVMLHRYDFRETDPAVPDHLQTPDADDSSDPPAAQP